MKFWILGFIFCTVLVLPESASAQLVTCQGLDCTACSFVEMINRIIQWIIAMFAVVAVLLLAWVGIEMIVSGGDQSALEKAKTTFMNLVIGIILVLASWMIINVILLTLTGNGLSFWGVTSCGGMVTPERTIEERLNESNTALEGPEAGVRASGDAGQIRTVLNAAGITVNKAECPTNTRYQDVTGGCTSVGEFNSATIDRLIEFQSGCGSACDVVLTGGTELGHAGDRNPGTHGGGDKFDLRPTASVNSYISGSSFTNTSYSGRSGRGNAELGVFCVREDRGTSNDHWDCYRTN